MSGNTSGGLRRAPTFFIDIDGTILRHLNSGSFEQWKSINDKASMIPPVLPSVFETWDAIEHIGGKIVLCTARPECLRQQTETELRACGLWWHSIVFGITAGDRVLVNDANSLRAPPDYCTSAYPVQRNAGLGGLLGWIKERYKL